jgi:hypothetical protein
MDQRLTGERFGPDYYRQRAAEMLKRAEQMATEEARNTFLELASGWDRMAQLLENSHR